jgi:hypothetical protein
MHYRRALEAAPDDAETRLLLARVLAAAGRPAEAATELREVLRLRPDHSLAAALLAELIAAR